MKVKVNTKIPRGDSLGDIKRKVQKKIVDSFVKGGGSRVER